MTEGNTPGEYVRQVREETQSYIKQLLTQNERLGGTLDSLRVQMTEIDSALQVTEKELILERNRRRELEQRLEGQEEEARQLSSRYVEVETLNNNLANLYVAGYQLHETLDCDRLMQTLQEILINLVGSEDFAILEGSSAEDLQTAITCTVLPDSERSEFRLDDPAIREAAKNRTRVVRDVGSTDDEVLAAIPLLAGERLVGVIAIGSLLSHKPTWDPLDFELFDLLATHAGMALYAGRLSER